MAKLMRNIFLLLGVIMMSTPAHATSRPILAGLAELAGLLLPSVQTQVQTAMSRPASQRGVLHYAVLVDVDVSSATDGQWLTRDGSRVWRMRFESEDAKSLSATLGDLHLPAGSILRIANAQGEVWAETVLTMQRDVFQTTMLPGEVFVLEVELSDTAFANPHIGVTQLQHGYVEMSQFEKSGSCNIDTVCPQGDNWTPQIRATARVTIDGSLCSAVLLNNTRNDGDPLLLTAHHCGLTASNAHKLQVYWNFETSQCGGRPDGSLRQSQSGATLLADNPNPDFSLARLDAPPLASYEVFYAGWDRSGNGFGNGVGVHHPSGDEKRISFFEQRPRKAQALVDGEPVQSWEVFWSEGVTESGSSGSPLFDTSGRFVGQLSGGNSSCENPGGSDVYGRLDYGWKTSNDAAEQLAVWLDPLNTGAARIDGLDSSDAPTKAQNDSYRVAPQVNQSMPLPVLANDNGARPLRILQATAANGTVAVTGASLQYTPGSSDHDTLNYVMIDRNGQTSSAQVTIDRRAYTANAASPSSTRGGAFGWPALFVLLSFAYLRKSVKTRRTIC